jgi:polysaccharide deacetylase family protein (PEP-CTERM system associated)
MTVYNLLTVDLEDWYHICGVDELIPESTWPDLEPRVVSNTFKLLNILKNHGAYATFFVLGMVAENHPDLVEHIRSAGHEIATHGYSHRRVYTMTPQAFRDDLKKSMDIICGITGQPIQGYRAPEWSIRDDSLWALEILKQEGFDYDSSMAPLPVIGNPEYSRIPHRLNLKSGKLWEFPPFVVRTPIVNLPMGGGWGLRIFPYTLIRYFIQKLNRRGQPALIFLHPREFDIRNPRIKLPTSKQLVLRARIERTEKRLIRLMNDFKFTSILDFRLKHRKNIAVDMVPV